MLTGERVAKSVLALAGGGGNVVVYLKKKSHNCHAYFFAVLPFGIVGVSNTPATPFIIANRPNHCCLCTHVTHDLYSHGVKKIVKSPWEEENKFKKVSSNAGAKQKKCSSLQFLNLNL